MAKKYIKDLLSFFLALIFLFVLVENSSANTSQRIVGGTATTIQKWPSLVSLQEKHAESGYWGHFCGGSLIRPRWVLTAKHCVEVATARDLDVVLRRTDLRSKIGERISVARIIKHPTVTVDLALVYLQKASKQKPIQIASPPTTENTVLQVAGWGASKTRFRAQLQETTLPLRTSSQCAEAYAGVEGEYQFNSDFHVCAGWPQGGKDTCQGDSGGPLVANNRLIGVTSFGIGCGEGSFPGVYVRSARFLPWINAVLANPPKNYPQIPPGKEKGGAPKPLMSINDSFSYPTDDDPFAYHAFSFDSNYHIVDLRVKFTATSDPYCQGATCYPAGTWLRPQMSSGYKNSTLYFKTRASCPKLYFWARLERPASASKIPVAQFIKTGWVGPC